MVWEIIVCLRYFAMVVLNHHNQGNYRRKSLLTVTEPEGESRTIMVKSMATGRHGTGAVTERLHKHKIKRKLIGLVLVV